MQIGIVGLGKMGGNMSRRLLKAGHQCVVFSRTAKTRDALASEGALASVSLENMVEKLGTSPRAIWLMLPAGQTTEETIEHLGGRLGTSLAAHDTSQGPQRQLTPTAGGAFSYAAGAHGPRAAESLLGRDGDRRWQPLGGRMP